MSWATCYSGCNNIEFNYPPLMSDGRNYCSWQPDAIVNRRIQQQENIHNNWSYRQYMQKNGLKRLVISRHSKLLVSLGRRMMTHRSITSSARRLRMRRVMIYEKASACVGILICVKRSRRALIFLVTTALSFGCVCVHLNG